MRPAALKLLSATLVFVTLWGADVLAQSIYTWVDDTGTLHATDRLQDVPEPFYTVYLEREKERERKRQERPVEAERQAPAIPPAAPARKPARSRPPATEPSLSESEHQRYLKWKGMLTRWRTELAAAVAAFAAAEERMGQLQMNPVLRLTPQVQAQIEEQRTVVDAARRRVMSAREMLLKGLPEQARKEQVPPAWLQ